MRFARSSSPKDPSRSGTKEGKAANGAVVSIHRQNAFPAQSKRLPANGDNGTGAIASAYDHVGAQYGQYADGEAPEDPATAAVRSAHADAIVWAAICKAIDELRDSGATTLRVLDAGCGPGSWLRRISARARRQGLAVDALGFDISMGQLRIARREADRFLADFADRDMVKLRFVEHDLTKPLPWADGRFHIVVCNYAVLNHLPRAALPEVVRELSRVASFRVIATARALASPPTASIASLDQVLDYHQDCGNGTLALNLKDGTKHVFTFNLYGARTLEALFANCGSVLEIRAIDLFQSRFAADVNWTASLMSSLPGRQEVVQKLRQIEEELCRLPGWIDHGTHVLIVTQPTAARARGALCVHSAGASSSHRDS